MVAGRTEFKKPDWPGPGDTNVPQQPFVVKDGSVLYTDGRITKLPENKVKKGDFRKEEVRERDGLGPGAYSIAAPRAGPKFTFGSRFNSSIRSKDHLRPRKVDGPGPGSYKLPSTVKAIKRTESHVDSLKSSTFGGAQRGFNLAAKDQHIGPGKYYPV
jgi:hypothetical protein